MRCGVGRANRLRAGVATMVAVGVVISGCTSDPVATPSGSLTLQSGQSVLAPSSPGSSSASAPQSAPRSAPQSLPPSASTARPTGSMDYPTSPDLSTVSSTVYTSTPDDPPDSSVTPRPPTSPPPTSGTTTPKPTTSAPTQSGGTSSTEAADRKAVEAAWVKYWGVFTDMMKVPKDARKSAYGVVAVDPLLSKMLKDALRSDEQRIANYGTVKHRYSWTLPIEANVAVFEDCMDQTKFGILDKQNKRFLTGSSNVNNQVTAVKTGGVWKIAGFVEKSGGC